MYTLLRYKYPARRLFIYINDGMSNGYAISERNYKKARVRYWYYSPEKTIEGVALKETRKYEQGFIIGLGSTYKRFSFEIRYERGNGMSTYSSLKSITKRYFILLGYNF